MSFNGITRDSNLRVNLGAREPHFRPSTHMYCYICKGSGATIKDPAVHKQHEYWAATWLVQSSVIAMG